MINHFTSYNSLPEPKYSNKHKKKINRIFREIANSIEVPYPEVDNSFEKFRSKLVIKWISFKNKF